MKHLLIHHFLEQSAELYPDKTALIHEKTRTSYAKINTLANNLAKWLMEKGDISCDRVVCILENSLEYIVSYYAILKTGAVSVSLSSDIKPNGLKPILIELKPTVLIFSSKFERLIKALDLSQFKNISLILIKPRLKWVKSQVNISVWDDIVKTKKMENHDIPIQKSDLASIIYTSGSTGKPKGVMLTHNNVVANTNSICTYLNLTDKDKQMVVLPFYYVMGKSLLNTHFAVGGTIVINNQFAFPVTVLTQMEEESVTGFSGVPSTYAYLLHRSPIADYKDRFKSLRYCTQAGGHMSKKIKKELKKVLPDHTEIYIMYGATEASARLTYLEPQKYDEKINSIGKPIPGVTIRVLDENGMEIPFGHTGELVASGKNIMQGYWKDLETTDKVLDKHGYHTGDQGYMDEEGYFYLKGRKDNIIKVGGHRINIQEIEDGFMETDLVIEAFVTSITDDLLGNKLIAIVTPKKNETSENMIMLQCAKKLPKYKLPGIIKNVKAIPKQSNGKIDREKCLKLIF